MTGLVVTLAIVYFAGVIGCFVGGICVRMDAFGDPELSQLGARMILLCWAWPFLAAGPTANYVKRLVADAGLTKKGVRDE